MGGRLFDWMGAGNAAARPAAAAMPALLVSPGSTAFYFAIDTKVLGVFDESGPSWFDIDAAALAAIAFLTLPDVDATGLADGNVFKYDLTSGNMVPLALQYQTTESIQDLVGAMLVNGTFNNAVYDDAAGTITFNSTLTQYTDELAQDAIAAAIAAGSHSGISISYNDAGNSFSFALTGSTYTDENAQDATAAMIAAGTHTGITIAYNDAGNAISFTVSSAYIDGRINAASIDALSDVDTTTVAPTTGQTLIWDGSKWKPGTPSSWKLAFRPVTGEAPASNYASINSRNGHPTLDFDQTTAESMIWTDVLPGEYSGNGFHVDIYWVSNSTTNNVVWQAAIERIDLSGLDTDADSFAATQTVTTACPATSGMVVKSTIAFSNSQIDGLLAGELFRLKITRDAANGSDTAAADAQVYFVKVQE